MKCRNIVVVAGMVILGHYNSMAQNKTTMTLRECVETALSNNLDIKQTELQSQVANISLKQARANLLPSFNASVNHGTSTGRSIDPFTNSYVDQSYNSANYNLSGDLTLFAGFRLMNAIKQNSLAFEASELEIQQLKDNTTIRVILAYLNVLSSQDQLVQVQSQVELTRKQVDRLTDMNNLGAIPPSDLSDFKGRLASDQASLINAQNNLNAARLSLAQLMNIPYNPNLELERVNVEQFDLDYAGDVESVYQAALQQLALVKAADLRKESAEKGVAVARGALSPTVSLGASIGTNYSSVATKETFLGTTDEPTGAYVDVGGTQYDVIAPRSKFSSEKISYGDQFRNNYGTSLGIGVQIPILNSFRARNQVKLAKITQKNAELVAQTTKIQLKQGVEQAWFDMTASRDRYKAVLDQVAAYTESFHAAEARYNAGATNTVDYLTARTNMDRANVDLIIARYDYLLKTRVLDYYQGKPLW